MSDSQIGWAPPERVKRVITLPATLDTEVQIVARKKRSAPSALLADALVNAIQYGWTGSQQPPPLGPAGTPRIVALDHETDRALQARIATLQSGGANTDLSALAALLVGYYLQHRVRTAPSEGDASGKPFERA